MATPFDGFTWALLLASREYRAIFVTGAEDIGLAGVLDFLRGRRIDVAMANDLPEPGSFDLLVKNRDRDRAVRALNRGLGVVAN